MVVSYKKYLRRTGRTLPDTFLPIFVVFYYRLRVGANQG